MRTRFTRALAVAAAVAAASTGLISTGASALPAGSPSFGVVTVTPSSGLATTNINMAPPSGAACPGDTAVGGYNWGTYIVSNSVDPATITYDGLGNPVVPAGAVGFPMFDTTGSPVATNTTAITTGLMTPLKILSLSALDGLLPAGNYNVGYACYKAGATERFWNTSMSITTGAGGLITGYSPFVVPGAPVLTSVTPGNGSLSGSFTLPAATPAATGSTVTLTGGPSPLTQSLAAGVTTFSFTGLTNGTTYSATVTQTNAAGTSAASNALTGVPADANQRPPVTNLSAVGDVASVNLSWTVPTGTAPTGYDIAVSPAAAGYPALNVSPTVTGTAATYTAAGLAGGTLYTITVTPVHPAPFFATSASVSATALNAQVLIQDLTVVRPAGALVLTQRCGVYGALPAEVSSGAFPVAIPAATATVDQVGTAPTVAGGGADPQFNNYPNPSPATYPTRCGVDMGSGSLITSGPLAGQYYTASGRLNRIEVLNTSDLDSGWTVSATMSAFTVAGGGASFSGDFLGWHPVVSSFSAPANGYNMAVNAGAAVTPNAPGLGTSKALASAPVSQGLGFAQLDARLMLLIPSTARAGTYTGTLTFTAL